MASFANCFAAIFSITASRTSEFHLGRPNVKEVFNFGTWKVRRLNWARASVEKNVFPREGYISLKRWFCGVCLFKKARESYSIEKKYLKQCDTFYKNKSLNDLTKSKPFNGDLKLLKRFKGDLITII